MGKMVVVMTSEYTLLAQSYIAHAFWTFLLYVGAS